MVNSVFYQTAYELLKREIQRLEAFCEALDGDRETKKQKIAEYKCAKYRYATVSEIHSMLYNCHRHGEKLKGYHYLLLPIDDLFKKQKEYVDLYNEASEEDRPDIGLYYGMMAFADFLIKDTKRKWAGADDWESIELAHRLDGYEFGRQCLMTAWKRRETITDEAKA